MKNPRPSRKVIPTFSDFQIQQLLNAIDTRTAEGYRDYALILILLDTGIRVSELCNLKLKNLWLEEGMLKVLGKKVVFAKRPVASAKRSIRWKPKTA